MFYVYILLSETRGKTYVGYTNDIDRRLIEHNDTATKGHTIKYRPWILIASKTFDTKSAAMQAEKFLKTGKGRIVVSHVVQNYLATGAVSVLAEMDWKSMCLLLGEIVFNSNYKQNLLLLLEALSSLN